MLYSQKVGGSRVSNIIFWLVTGQLFVGQPDLRLIHSSETKGRVKTDTTGTNWKWTKCKPRKNGQNLGRVKKTGWVKTRKVWTELKPTKPESSKNWQSPSQVKTDKTEPFFSDIGLASNFFLRTSSSTSSMRSLKGDNLYQINMLFNLSHHLSLLNLKNLSYI